MSSLEKRFLSSLPDSVRAAAEARLAAERVAAAVPPPSPVSRVPADPDEEARIVRRCLSLRPMAARAVVV